VLGSIQPQAIPNRPDGTMDLAEVEAAIKPDDPHFARTRLIALENTIGGRVLPTAYVRDVQALARRRGLALHLDGARAFNAAVALGADIREVCRGFDSVSLCLSKGLGAPAGSVLCGDRAFIGRARRCRKILGGGMRQVGMLAAAGLHALEHHVGRLAIDHAHAEELSQGLAAAGYDVTPARTNMVFMESPPGFVAHCAGHGVVLLDGPRLRLVTHLDVTAEGIQRMLRAARQFRVRTG